MGLEAVFRIVILGLAIGCVYALIAIGLNLLWGTMRLLNVAHGDLIMLGAYTAYWLFTLYGVSPLQSAIVAAIGCGALGLLVYKVIFARSLKTVKELQRLEAKSLLIFFGLSMLIQNIASLLWGADVRKYTYLVNNVTLLSTPVPLNKLLAALISIVVCAGFYIFLRRTLFGKAVRAVIQDKRATQLAGIDTNKVYIFCFGIAFALAGLAGALLSMLYVFTPAAGMTYTIFAFIVIILGGLGNLLGTLIGGLLLGLIVTLGVSLATPGYAFIIMYLLFIFVILFMPAGILGRTLRWHPT